MAVPVILGAIVIRVMVTLGFDFIQNASKKPDISSVLPRQSHRNQFILIPGRATEVVRCLPADVRWKHIVAVSVLGGIGFTMSMFIAMIAFQEASHIGDSKIAILVASANSGLTGYLSLRWSLRPNRPAPSGIIVH